MKHSEIFTVLRKRDARYTDIFSYTISRNFRYNDIAFSCKHAEKCIKMQQHFYFRQFGKSKFQS